MGSTHDSTRKDASIKNLEALDYGVTGKSIFTTKTDAVANEKNFDYLISSPKRGRPLREGTPDELLLTKHEKLYENFTLEDAYKERKLDSEGKIHYLQKVSKWQRKAC